MNITDFGSTFKKHEPDHQRFFNLTTYQQFYDRKENPTAQETIEKDEFIWNLVDEIRLKKRR